LRRRVRLCTGAANAAVRNRSARPAAEVGKP